MRVRRYILYPLILLVAVSASVFGQLTANLPTIFRSGERLSYNVSFEKFNNVAFFETYVVSTGKMAGRDVVELQARVKTFDIVSAAFMLIDESRTVFAAPDSGLPVFITRTLNAGVIAKETNQSFLAAPTSNFDLLTLIFKTREANGTGTYPFSENGETYVATLANGASEKVKTDVGDFETTISTVQSTYLDGFGIKELKINLSADEYRVPVLIRFRTDKGAFVANLASMTFDEIKPITGPTPIPSQTPRPAVTPRPLPTPEPYVDNMPLLKELIFELGESLEYKVTSARQPVANIVMQAKERKQVQGIDTLLLTAAVTGIDQRNRTFALGDSIITRVDPDTLAPRTSAMKFAGQLAPFSQAISVDQVVGMILFGANRVESPVGTHSLLSLIYGMRSFNLKPSKDASNPVNDTRVAVFWQDKPYIFVLRPSNAETITINGEKVGAQMISITTRNPQLDALAIKVWLSTDDLRLPLRFSVGAFQADLIASTNIFRP